MPGLESMSEAGLDEPASYMAGLETAWPVGEVKIPYSVSGIFFFSLLGTLPHPPTSTGVAASSLSLYL